VKVKDITQLFHKELSGKFPDEEIRSFVNYSVKYILGYSRTGLVLKKEDEITEAHYLKFIEIVEKLKTDQPIQYIIGETDFYGLSFFVNSGVLVPRPETEELVDWIIKENKNEKASVLDIGTGSGCIAIAIKKYFHESSVLAVDISDNALSIAKKNALRNETIIDFLKLDILNFVDNGYLQGFDMIVSNPPYVRESEKTQMKDNVLKYEPAEALFVPDNDPLLYYKAIADFSVNHLYKGGYLYFEINEDLSDQLERMLVLKGFSEVYIKKDINGKYRMLRCTIV
jgi:release factor glutamine methyltransferase